MRAAAAFSPDDVFFDTLRRHFHAFDDFSAELDAACRCLPDATFRLRRHVLFSLFHFTDGAMPPYEACRAFFFVTFSLIERDATPPRFRRPSPPRHALLRFRLPPFRHAIFATFA